MNCHPVYIRILKYALSSLPRALESAAVISSGNIFAEFC